jgi:CO/xanthine dehydrogenase Mo-binding subunit
MDGPAPAIVNAIEDALHLRFDSLPVLAEDIFQVLAANSGAENNSPVPQGVQ